MAFASRRFSIRCAYISINVNLNVSESFVSIGGGCVISSALGSTSIGDPAVSVAVTGMPVPEGLPKDISKVVFPNDFDWSAKNRDRILAEWQKRYAK